MKKSLKEKRLREEHLKGLLYSIDRDIMLQKLLDSGKEIYVREELDGMSIEELRFVCLTYDINRNHESYRKEHLPHLRNEIHARLEKKYSEYNKYSRSLKEILGQEKAESIIKNYPVRHFLDD